MKRTGIGRIIAGCILIGVAILFIILHIFIPDALVIARVLLALATLYILIPLSIIFLIFGIRCRCSSKSHRTTDPNIIASKIATQTLNILDSVNKSTLLSKNAFTRTDAVIFSCFVTRAFCITSISDRSKSMEFSNAYIDAIKEGLLNTYMRFNQGVFQEMFNNRVDLYDRIVIRPSDSGNPLEDLAAEFEIVILTDIMEKKYVPFSEESPLPILGFMENMMCQLEANLLLKTTLAQAEAITSSYKELFDRQ